MIIDILGTGITAGFYRWYEAHEIWSIGVAYKMHQLQEHKCDLYFCFHDERENDVKASGVPFLDKETYPLDEIIEKYGSKYFTSSIAYMLAYAITKEPEEINLWGIDLEHGTEYAHQRPCILYWIGQAEARGIKVTTSSGLSESPFMYGYVDTAGLFKQLEMRKNHAEKMAFKVTNEKEKEQWIGKMVGMRDAINILRG